VMIVIPKTVDDETAKMLKEWCRPIAANPRAEIRW
jgi:hypothetical protein